MDRSHPHHALLTDYDTWLRSWASRRTAEARVALAAMVLREHPPDELTSDVLTGFLARPGLSAWTRATYHSHLADLCAWLVATGRLEDDPMDKVRAPRRPSGMPRPLSESEVARVLAVVEGQTRDWIMLALLAGLRVSEIARVRGEDVNPDGLFVRGKGDKSVTLPCAPELWEMAQRYPRTGYWFPGPDDGHIRPQRISAAVGSLFNALGISGSIHRMRHVYGTRLLRSGVHIRQVQRLMRHANLTTTANYTAVDEDELRDALALMTTRFPTPGTTKRPSPA